MQKFSVDISSRVAPMVLYAAQGDTKSRFFSVAMFDSGVEYSLPSGASVTVRFGAPGMPAGWYDIIQEPGGESHPAVSVDGNVITAELAEQAVSVPGKNGVWLLVNAADGYQLASWGFDLFVEAVHGLDAPEATVYYNALTEQVAKTLANAQAAAASAAQAQQYAESINPAQFATAAQGAKADTAVQSVNGQRGTDVTLTPSIIGAADAAAVGDRLSALSEDIATERARIDAIASLAEGSTTGDAELIDIRVGVGGTTYNSAGAAVRGQIGELKGDLDSSNELNYDIYEYTENRFFIENLEENKYISNDGNILDYHGWNLSDYLPVEKNEIYWWTFYSDKKEVYHVVNIYYGLYDVNRNWIGAGTTLQSPDGATFVQTDNNTAYVRISQESKYFTNTSMLIKRSLIESGVKTFIPFKRYLKKSPTKEIEEKTDSFETNYLPGYDNVVRSIQRIGEGMSYPIHSVEAFKEAYKKGFRILLCDLIFTGDNIPVCNHDSYLNQYYKNVYDSSGNLVSTDNPIYFSQNTYETLSQYSYGAVGYPLLKFADMLKLVRQLGVELYVEIKGMTEPQSKIACSLVEQYGLADKTSWSGNTQQMKWVISNIDTARVSIMPGEITDVVIEDLNSLKTGKNKVFIFGWDTTVLSDEIVNKLIQNNIAFEQGTLFTNEDVINYFNRGEIYYYCTGIETNSVVAGKVLIENSLSN